MNILFVNDIPFNPIGGGIERVTDVLAKGLIKRGYKVYYLCGKLPQSKQYLLNYDFPAQLYQLPQFGLFENEDNILYYKNLQDELEIDVVVNQRGLGGGFNGLLPITQTKIVSVIHSVPDGDVRIFLNKLVELTVPPFEKIKKFIKIKLSSVIKAYWKRKALEDAKTYYNELAQYSDVIVTLSRGDIDMLNRLIGITKKTKIINIPNPNTFDQINTISEPKKKILLYVGRLEKTEKEPLRLLKIWNILHKKHPDWQLKIVGDGEERNAMKNYVESQKINNVFFKGRKVDVSKYYREASFVCLTSNFEGWGMSLTEGMQYGCVPFTFGNYGAAYEIIDDGVNGCIIPAFDIKLYARRLSELMENKDKCMAMSKAAIEKVQLFSVEEIVDKWEEMLNSLN